MFQKRTPDPNMKSAMAEHLSSGSLEGLYFQPHSALMTTKRLLRMPNIQKNEEQIMPASNRTFCITWNVLSHGKVLLNMYLQRHRFSSVYFGHS